jgi:chromosome partitioning protein
MNVIVFASRKGGTGKSTLAAHLAAYNHKAGRSCLLIDADPQGSLTLWHRLRKTGEPPLQNGLHNFSQSIENARLAGFDWVLVDTPPLASAEVSEAISAATLVVIPVRPSVFDLNAIMETIAVARLARKPFAVILNAVPPKRLGNEPPIMLQARRGLADLEVPVWSGQVTQRAIMALALAVGAGVEELNIIESRTAAEEIAGLWVAIENSVKAIHGTHSGIVMHQRAA